VVVPQAEPKDEPAADDDAVRQSPEPAHETEQTPRSPNTVKKRPVTGSPMPRDRHEMQKASPDFDEKAKQLAMERYKNISSEKPSTNLLEYGYWLLLLAFIPLVFSLLQETKEDTVERLLRSIEKSAPAKEEKTASKQTPKEKTKQPLIAEEPFQPDVSLDDLIARLPGGRIEGAFLPRKTVLHWIYALLAAAVFFTVTFFLFPGAWQATNLIIIGVFTATIGILLLVLAQLLAEWTQGHFLISGNFVILLLFWVAWAIGFSYRSAMDPEISVIPSFFGFTFGVGLCEEVCKALPLLWHYRVKGGLPWREACAWGFVSGVGFGISEGIMYSADFYNGIATGAIYLVRFVSCVALHGIWTASAALFIHKFQHIIQAEFVWYEWIPRALFMVGIPMIFHGMYDTFLKREMNVLALVTALISFVWFAWSIENARRSEETPKMALGRS
jgi:RsiW-degrading membrane proteinase PrsW (M82 family)